jgi:hypothetical protein
MVGVPVAAAVLMQHTGRSKGTSRLAVELTQTSSSSKVGTFCSGHTHNSQQQQQQAAAAAAPAEACTSISRSWIQFSCTLLLGCATCCRTVSTRGVGTAGAGEGVGNPQGVSSPAVVATGPPSVAATASGPPAPIHGGDDPAATLQPAASQPPTVPSGASARPAAFQQQQQQQVLPALVASCGPEGFRELPPQLWYTAVTRLMPVNFKVRRQQYFVRRLIMQIRGFASPIRSTCIQDIDVVACVCDASPSPPQARGMSCLHLPAAEHAIKPLCPVTCCRFRCQLVWGMLLLRARSQQVLRGCYQQWTSSRSW